MIVPMFKSRNFRFGMSLGISPTLHTSLLVYPNLSGTMKLLPFVFVVISAVAPDRSLHACRIDIAKPAEYQMYVNDRGISSGSIGMYADVRVVLGAGVAESSIMDSPDDFELCITWDSWRSAPTSCRPLTTPGIFIGLLPPGTSDATTLSLNADDTTLAFSIYQEYHSAYSPLGAAVFEEALLRRFEVELRRIGSGNEMLASSGASYYTKDTAPMHHSSWKCTGSDQTTARCIFRNVVVSNGTIFVFTNGEPAKIPELLCSSTNWGEDSASAANKLVAVCNVRFLKLKERDRIFPSNSECSVEFGAALYRVFSWNPFHNLFENVVPAFSLLHEGAGLSPDPAHGLDQLKTSSWGLFFTDFEADEAKKSDMLSEFLAEVRVVRSSEEACHVSKLVAGTKGSCIHWGLCKSADGRSMSYSPSNAAVIFRRHVLHRFGIAFGADDGSELNACTRPRTGPRVLIVQRPQGRRIDNIIDVKRVVAVSTGAASVRVVDMGEYTQREQVSMAHSADIFILAHGAALMGMIWLPPGAVIVDVLPYAFNNDHGVVQSALGALHPLSFLHAPFQISNSTGQTVSTGLIDDCRCPLLEPGVPKRHRCAWHVFWNTHAMMIDLPSFEKHLRETTEKWRRGEVTKPLSQLEFNTMMEQRHLGLNKVEGPLCWHSCALSIWAPVDGSTYSLSARLRPEVHLELGECGLSASIRASPLKYEVCISWNSPFDAAWECFPLLHLQSGELQLAPKDFVDFAERGGDGGEGGGEKMRTFQASLRVVGGAHFLTTATVSFSVASE